MIRYARTGVRKTSNLVRMRAPAEVAPSTAVGGIAFPAADPRGPVSDSLRSFIDGARTVGASRVTTRGLLELASDVCSRTLVFATLPDRIDSRFVVSIGDGAGVAGCLRGRAAGWSGWRLPCRCRRFGRMSSG
jgi:hypothetical protein